MYITKREEMASTYFIIPSSSIHSVNLVCLTFKRFCLGDGIQMQLIESYVSHTLGSKRKIKSSITPLIEILPPLHLKDFPTIYCTWWSTQSNEHKHLMLGGLPQHLEDLLFCSYAHQMVSNSQGCLGKMEANPALHRLPEEFKIDHKSLMNQSVLVYAMSKMGTNLHI